MILTLLILFFAISLIALVLSLVFKEPYYALVGFFLLFYLSFAFMTDGVDYKTGESELAVYAYDNSTLSNTTTTTTYLYDTLDTSYRTFAWWFGFLMAITTAFSFVFVLYDLRQDAGLKRAKEIGEEMP